MADEKPITVQPAANLSGKADVALNKSDFEAAIETKGVKVWHDHSIKCPCSSKEGTPSQSSCKNCGGSGWLYVNRTETRMVVQAMNVDTKLKEWSEERLGIAKITARSRDRLTFMDRITLLDSESEHSEVIFLKEQPNASTLLYGNLRYDPIEIYSVFLYVNTTTKHTLLVEGTDYAVVRNQIRLLAVSIGDIENPTLSIRYRHRAEYTILDIPRDIMVSPTKASCTKRDLETQFPISAIGRRSHYMPDRNDFENDDLLDNSFIGDPVTDFYCLPSTYRNSDGSFTQIITSGDTFTSADIVVTINGVPQPPSITNVNLSFTISADPVSSTFNGNPTALDTPSGTNLALTVVSSLGLFGLIGTLITDLSNAKIIQISDAPLSLEGVPFALGVRAQAAMDIELVDSDDNPLSANVVTDTYALKKLEVITPPATPTLKYNLPQPIYQTSYDTYDEGWHYTNGTYANVIGSGDKVVTLDPDDWYKISDDIGSKGNLYRFWGLAYVGYYNSDTDTYHLADGTASDRATIFDDDDYAIDRLTGLAFRTRRGGSTNYSGALSGAASASWSGFSDWYLPMKLHMDTIVDYTKGALVLYAINSPIFDMQLNAKTCTPYSGNPTGAAWLFASAGGYTPNRAHTNTDATFYIRRQES